MDWYPIEAPGVHAQARHEEIQRQMDEFYSRGGRITVVPTGESGGKKCRVTYNAPTKTKRAGKPWQKRKSRKIEGY